MVSIERGKNPGAMTIIYPLKLSSQIGITVRKANIAYDRKLCQEWFEKFRKHISMGEGNTIVSACTTYRHLQ